jgi:glycosidase
VKRALVAAALALGCAGDLRVASPAAPRVPQPPRVMYLVVTDRFTNGDPSNDDAGPPGCLDRADPRKLHGGDLAGLRKRIGYLEELGVTTLWTLPVYAQSPDRCGYHGYWADFVDPDDGRIAPTLGEKGDLSSLLDDLHARKMGLVLDMVVNHAGPGARVVAQHPDWFHDPVRCEALGAREVFCPIGGKPLPDFAQEKPEVAAYLTGMSVGWATRFAIDGIRMDTVKHVPLAYWKEWRRAIAAARPGLFTVGEVFDTGAAARLAPYLDAGFDSLFNYPLYAALVATFAEGGSVDAIADAERDQIATFGAERAGRMTSFIDNHDVPRFTSRVAAGTSVDEIARRQNLALGAIFTLPGLPQLYYGDEIALYGGKDPDNRRDMPDWAWTAEGRRALHPGEAPPNAQGTFAHVQTLVRLRDAHPALREGGYTELSRKGPGDANVLAFYRAAGQDRLVVVINAGAAPARVVVPLRDAALEGTTLRDLVGRGAPPTAIVAKGTAAVALPPLTMGVYAPSR